MASIPMICGQDITITVRPSNPIPKGQSVSLSPRIFAGLFRKCQWLQGNKVILSQEGMSPYLFETGEAYNERESVGLDCSLSIQGVQKEDAGFYTVLIDRGGNSTERGQVNLQVSDSGTSTWDEAAWNYNRMVTIVVAVTMTVLLIGAGFLIFFCVRFRKPRSSRHVAVTTSSTPPPSAPLPSAPPSSAPPPYENICPYGPPASWVHPENASSENIYATSPYRVQPGKANQEPRSLQAAQPLP
nr:PREDICTED: uncharacterized protein LOC103281273 isoform X1 [Anolis carolinensis]|eukprot:XP_008120717.1 PREDICTED: uncharacterized protein LOC103281273 isoform X1 [Anolis carolinensis]